MSEFIEYDEKSNQWIKHTNINSTRITSEQIIVDEEDTSFLSSSENQSSTSIENSIFKKSNIQTDNW
ncbi:12962_t:CDS:1, partial [Acaulospora morrowiae]